MKNKCTEKILTIGLPTILAGIITMSSKNGSLAWLGVLIGIISLSMIHETFTALSGQRVSWDYLTPRDKIIFIICTIANFVSVLYPIKEGMSPFIVFVSGLTIFALWWIVTYKFGSEGMKARLLWPKPNQKP